MGRLLGIAVLLGLFLFLALYGNLFESVDAEEIMVVQHPTSGELTWYATPGIKWQGFGRVTVYRKLSSMTFKSKVMFNDNGTGHLLGTFQVEMPMDPLHLTSLHSKYGSQEAVNQGLVRATLDKVVYMTGPLMSSKESSAERKTDLIRYIADQVEHGVYRTVQRRKVVEDLAKEKKEIVAAEISVSADGKAERQEESVVSEFGIKIVNFAPSDLDYDDAVKAQIKKQQDITMQVQTAMAQAREAEQRKLTAEANGLAEVMKAKYEKEVDKIQAVTEAQRDLEVQTLTTRKADLYKRQQILEGEGEAEKKKLVMNADGALAMKLEAYLETQKAWAAAFSHYSGPLVPSVLMASEATPKSAGSTPLQLLEIMAVKSASDLAIDMRTSGKAKTKGAE